MKKYIYLIRHGESQWNVEHRFQGNTPHAPGLTEKGRQDILALKKKLPAVDHIYTSPATRTRESAALFANGAPVTELAELRERTYGSLDGMLRDDAQKKFPSALKAYEATRELPGIAGAESTELMGRRGLKALEFIAHSTGQRFAVFTHGAVIRSVAALVEKKPYMKMGKVENSGWVVVEYDTEKNIFKLALGG